MGLAPRASWPAAGEPLSLTQPREAHKVDRHRAWGGVGEKAWALLDPGPPSLDRRHLGLRKSWVQSEGWRPVSGVTSAPPGGLRLSRFNQLCALIHSPVHPGGTCSPHAPPVFWGAPPPSGPLPFPARHAVSLTGVRGSHAEPHPHTSPWPGLGLENHLSPPRLVNSCLCFRSRPDATSRKPSSHPRGLALDWSSRPGAGLGGLSVAH